MLVARPNCFIHETHAPIVAPETLTSQPVQAIIVMAASYSDEVAENISRTVLGIRWPSPFSEILGLKK